MTSSSFSAPDLLPNLNVLGIGENMVPSRGVLRSGGWVNTFAKKTIREKEAYRKNKKNN